MGTPSARRRAALWGLGAYLLILAALLLLPVSYGAVISGIGEWIRADLGLTSFGYGWIEFVANVFILMPLGFLLGLLFRRYWHGLVLAIVLSAAAELAQAMIPARVPSLRDVLANTIGAALGAALAWFLVRRRAPERAADLGADA